VEQTGNVGVWLRAVPDQRILHVVRHPCGFVDSVLGGEKLQKLRGGVPTSLDPGIFAHVSRLAVAEEFGFTTRSWSSMSPHQRLAAIWLCLNEQAAIDGTGLANYRQVYFDDFCADPHFQTESMFEFLGLAMSQQTREFLLKSTRTDSHAYFSVNRESAAVPNSWSKRLSDQVVDEIMDIANLGTNCRELIDGKARKPVESLDGMGAAISVDGTFGNWETPHHSYR